MRIAKKLAVDPPRRGGAVLKRSEVLEAVRLLQNVDQLPVEGRHIGAQLDLQRRYGKLWRQLLGSVLRELQAFGLVQRVPSRRLPVVTGTGRNLGTEAVPGGWVVGQLPLAKRIVRGGSR